MMIILTIMSVTAHNKIVKIKYEFFSYTHFLYFAFMVLFFLHGSDLWLSYLPLSAVICGAAFLFSIFDILKK